MKTKNMPSHVWIIVIMSLAAAWASAGSMPSASELIDKYSHALDSTASFIEEYEKTGEYRGHFPADHPFYSVYGSKKFCYDTFERGIIKFKENKGDYHQQYKWGYFNEELKNIPEDKPISRLWIFSKTFNYFHQVNKFGQKIDRAERRNDTPVTTIKPPDCIVGISHILGYVDTEERLDKVLRKVDHIVVRNKTEKIGDADCFVIDADTKYGRYLIWIDPEHGYHAAMVKHRAEEGQYLHTKIIPKGSIATGYSEILQFKLVDNIWVPVEVKAGFHRTVGSPEYYMDEEAHYKRTKIVLNPDHEKLGSFADPILENPANDPELKNGTRVRINADQKEYIWQDGKVLDTNGKIIMERKEK